MTSQTAREATEEVVCRIAELPDRTSPDDWPEAMLVTADELTDILADAFARIEAEALARGRMEGAKAMQDAVILEMDECCEPCFQCNQNVTDLDPTVIVKGLNDAD